MQFKARVRLLCDQAVLLYCAGANERSNEEMRRLCSSIILIASLANLIALLLASGGDKRLLWQKSHRKHPFPTPVPRHASLPNFRQIFPIFKRMRVNSYR